MKTILNPARIAFSLFGVVLLGGLCLSPIDTTSAKQAQENRPATSVNREELRSRFAAAAGQDFEIVKDEFKSSPSSGGGGSYWLAYLKPKHAGSFSLTYSYNYNDPHYSHVEREFGLNVGQTGCRRGVPSAGSYHRFCLGDTIIFPVAINNFTEHQFNLNSREYTKEQDEIWESAASEPRDGRLDCSQVQNPVADYLRYVGSDSHKLLPRNGGYTLESYAVFEAQQPGRFNLAMGAVFSDLPSAILSATQNSGGVPIIIVSRETPVTLLASHHEVRGYTMGFNGKEYCSSTSGDSFMTDVTILQPGDRISLKYYTTIRWAAYERRERSSPADPEIIPPPRVSKVPFSLSAESNFTGWLTDYLPR
jgi:hypothetical protein